MHRLAVTVARFARWLSRRSGRGGGTTLPGVVLLRLDPEAIRRLAARLDGCILISATNGKTTTTRLVATALEATGAHVVTNSAGSNLARGVAAALLDAPDSGGIGVLEVDEAALEAVAEATAPDVIVLMNLFRDQLDRFGELDVLVNRWQDVLTSQAARSEPPVLVVCADDPNLATIATHTQPPEQLRWFGFRSASTQGTDVGDLGHGDATVGAPLAHAADATLCRRCGEPLAHDHVVLGHLGSWRCTACDNARPDLDTAVEDAHSEQGVQQVALALTGVGAAEQTLVVRSPLQGLHNAYNLAAAATAVLAFDRRQSEPGAASRPERFDGPALAAALGRTAPAFGRGETVTVGQTPLTLLLAKNPTGVNQNIRTVLDQTTRIDALLMLNDRTADGRDVSWIWDVDWEPLLERPGQLTLSGDRAHDLALRLRYAGAAMDHVAVAADPGEALDAALATTPSGSTLWALPTYTAMLDLRAVLTERGHTQPYWEAP